MPSSSTPSRRPDGRAKETRLPDLRIGDVVFIRIGAAPFRQVAAATGSWTNHVGVVVGRDDGRTVIGESRFPISGTTSLSRFVARSERRRVAVARLKMPLSPSQHASLAAAARARNGILYDTGFDLHSRRQFCSRYVHEVLHEATGVRVGEARTFRELLAEQPGADLAFWRAWYFGLIPWNRRTVTPASLLASPSLEVVFDGIVDAAASLSAGSGARPC